MKKIVWLNRKKAYDFHTLGWCIIIEDFKNKGEHYPYFCELSSYLFNFLDLNIFRDFDTYKYKVVLLNKECLSRERFCAMVLSISLHQLR